MTYSDVGPFAIVPERLLSLNGDAVRVWCLLSRYANSEGVAWPSHATLAERLGLSVDTVQRRIAELCDFGCLEVRSGRGQGVSNRYFLKYAAGVPQPSTRGGTAPVHYPGTAPVRYERKPIERKPLNTSSPPTPSAAIDLPPPPSHDPEGMKENFSRFLEIYPPPEGGLPSRDFIYRVWHAQLMASIELATIVAGVERYARFIKAGGNMGKSMCPGRWLREKRWEQGWDIPARTDGGNPQTWLAKRQARELEAT